MYDVVRRYAAYGMSLRVEAESPDLADRVDALLRHFSVSDAAPEGVEFTFVMRRGDPSDAPPPGDQWPKFWAGVLPGGLAAAIHAGPRGRRVALGDQALLLIDLPGRRAELIVRPGKEWAIEYGCIVPTLCEFLAEVGQFVIHAASLSAEVAGESRAVLLSGLSGMGKTTAALALARDGMRLMADDASFAGRLAGGDSLAVWGLPRRCKVHAETLALFPWLADLPRRPAITQNEYFVDLAAMAITDTPRQIRPAVLLFLARRNDVGHRLVRMDRLSALKRLTRENVRACNCSASGPAGGAFTAFTELVRTTAAYTLSEGPSLDGLADAVRDLPALRE